MARFPWTRKKKSTTVQIPEEVNQYYESTRKERVGIAWLLALATLLLTLLIAAAIFFAGRWVYRRIADRNNSAHPTSQNESASDQSASSENKEGSSSSTDGSSTNGSSTNGSSTGSNATGSGSSSTQTPSTSTPAQTPTTGPSTSELPHTGPDISD